MGDRIAIIDLGSNSVRLVIMEINDNNSYRIINEVKETVRLSEGMGEDNILRPDAIQRTLKTLKLFRSLCDASSITHSIAVATAAVRRAKNQSEFVRLVEQETGILLDVISGNREAALGYMGVENTLDITDGYVMDIGGASTEITKFADRKIVEAVSLPFGAVTLTEQYLNRNVNGQKQIEALEKLLLKQYNSIPWLKNVKTPKPLIGLGGTIRNLCKIDRVRKDYSLGLTHNYTMNPKDIAEIFDDIKYKNFEERTDIPGMSKDRADIIVAGACAVNVLLKKLGTDKFIISGSGIREGLFFEYYMERAGLREASNVCDFSIDNFLKLYNVNLVHAKQVKRLALEAYDQLAPLHKLAKEYRGIFEKAALMHDAGIAIDFYNRDMHTYYLIVNSRINGLTHREIILIALIASKFNGEKLRRHYMLHKDILSKDDYNAIKKLISILSVCDKLDRSKSNVVKEIECIIKSDKVIIEVEANNLDGELEIAEANKQQGAFKKVFGKSLQIV